MEHNQLARLVSPVHRILQRISASEIEQAGIFPERLTLMFEVSREREGKFAGAIMRMLAVDETYNDQFRSSSCLDSARSPITLLS